MPCETFFKISLKTKENKIPDLEEDTETTEFDGNR
jgi:hypothetical protein